MRDDQRGVAYLSLALTGLSLLASPFLPAVYAAYPDYYWPMAVSTAVVFVAGVTLAYFNFWPRRRWDIVDNFNRGEIGEKWDTSGRGWGISQGRLEVHYDPPDQQDDWRHAWLTDGMKQERVTIRCDFGIHRSYAEFGLSLCTRDRADKYTGYHLWFWENGVKLAKPGQANVHHDRRWNLCPGQTYSLELQKDGGRLSAEIDGQLCFEYTDQEHVSLYQSGKRFIGFGFNFNGGWIDNVRIKAK